MLEVRLGTKQPHLGARKAPAFAQKTNEEKTKSSNLGPKVNLAGQICVRGRERSCLGETRMFRGNEAAVISSALESVFLFPTTLRSAVADNIKILQSYFILQ